MQVACFVFIQRRWEEDKKHLENMLDYFCDIREPLQLLLFPEGTDLTGEHLDHILSYSQNALAANQSVALTPVACLCTDTVTQTQSQSDKTHLNPLSLSFLQECSDLCV